MNTKPFVPKPFDPKSFAVEQLSFSFNRTDTFFENLSFSCAEPGLIFVRGKNGIGKSTLFRLLQGSLGKGELVSGQVTIDGSRYDLANTRDRALLHECSIAMAQESALMVAPRFTGFENLAYACLSRYPDFSFAPVTQVTPDLARQFAIPLDLCVGELSGGQRQMLALLMVTQRPLQVLFLDEPTAALDEKNARLVMDFIRQLVINKNIFVICISHDAVLVQEYADLVVQIAEDMPGKRTVTSLKRGKD
jgi:ABC-type multidrug transport system ATPase subunit